VLQAKSNLTDVKICRAGGYLSFNGDVLVQLMVGSFAEQATTLRWAVAAATHNIDNEMQNVIAEEFAAAYADPLFAVQWL